MADWLASMKKKAETVRDKMGSGGSWKKKFNLTGKSAEVKPGGQVVLRLLPRWDIKDAFVKKGTKFVANPKYKGGPIYLEAFEHWWDGPGGQRTRVWCPKTLDKKGACPVCEGVAQLRTSPDPDDKKLAGEHDAREVFLFNMISKDPNTKKRRLAEDGSPDIRILVAHNTIFLGISNIMTGGGDDEFARGDVSNPKEGYDLLFTRPSGGGDRWKVDPAPKSTPLYTADEKSAWGNWVTKLHDLQEWLKEEMKGYDELHKEYHGTSAEGASRPEQEEPAEGAVEEPGHDQAGEGEGEGAGEEEGSGAPWGFDL